MNEMAGIIDAKRLSVAGYTGRQEVTVAHDNGIVRLSMASSSYPAGLTPEQARFLARRLYRMARLADEPSPSTTSKSPPVAQEAPAGVVG